MNATVQRLREEQAKKVAEHLSDIGEVLAHLDYADCCVTYDYSQGPGTDTDVRVVFAGPSGRHSLDVLSSDRARVLAHWDGFVSQNGGGWAKVRRMVGREARKCGHCKAALESGQFVVAADFGVFCCGDCADRAHEEEEGSDV
jgi:hypothetical protein